jgi:hypothetical protein
MAFLACTASHAINGVAAIHSEIIKNTIFKVGGGRGQVAFAGYLMREGEPLLDQTDSLC